MSTVPIDSSGTPKRKKRIFVWFFLAVQVIFIAWIIGGIVSASGGDPDCVPGSSYGGPARPDWSNLCESASNVGTGIGVALVIGFWCVVDFILGVGYAVYRLARRP